MRWKTLLSFVLGLSGSLFAWIPVLGLVCAVSGLIFAVGAVQEHGDAFAYGALTLSVVATVSAGVFFVVFLVRVASV